MAAVLAGACGPRPGPAAGAPVLPGIDVLLEDSVHLIAGRRIGLITNRSGLDARGRRSIDRLAGFDGGRLLALFSPEHGIRGDAPEGAVIDDEVDPVTGLPVHSLYGGTRRPTEDMLDGLDVLLFDLQDVGARYYTYVSTMAYAMEAAGERGLPFVVLDRPNPIGGRVQGPVLDTAYASFVGLFPVPVRHGMTAGELARLYQGEFGLEALLHVVPARGWRRDLWFDETGLPWVPPSPNMPSLESAAHYPGTCLFEGTNLSVGRGTPAAFQQIGAPWLDGAALAHRLGSLGLPGVAIEAVSFTPDSPGDGKFDGREVRGVRFTVTDRGAYDPVRTGVAALLEARRLGGERFAWNPAHFDRLAGVGWLREAIEAGEPLDEIVDRWREPLERFHALRVPYLLYPDGP